MLREIRIPVASYAMTGITMVKTAHNVMFDRLLTLFLTHRLAPSRSGSHIQCFFDTAAAHYITPD
jgi:hypothetical protein